VKNAESRDTVHPGFPATVEMIAWQFASICRLHGAEVSLEERGLLTRVAVILHERRGNWAGQLRTRLQDRPVRWMETRSAADLDAALLGLACPVVLIDLRNHAAQGLEDLDRVLRQSPAARVLVLDPEANEGVAELARELGASLAIAGFVPPPDVTSLLDRWIKLAVTQTEREGWSRSLAAEPPFDAESLLELALIEQTEKTDTAARFPDEKLPSNPPLMDDGHTAPARSAGHLPEMEVRGQSEEP
jgi:chemotaxis response regulator CheB